MENTDFVDRLALVNGNILTDRLSGRKLVLNATAVQFYEIYRSHGASSMAYELVTEKFGLPPATARLEYERFLRMIDQGQRCEGSILPGAHHAVLEPTAACNGQCPHCYHGDRSSRWARSEFSQILDRVRAGDVRSVSLTGGEVFSAHFIEPFFQLVEELNRRQIVIASISTNATFLTEEIRDRVLECLRPPTVFRISLDALRGDLLDRIRPGYRKLSDPYEPIRDLDHAGYPLVFTTNLFHTQPVAAVLEIGEFLRDYQNIKAWNVRLAVPVHYGSGDRTRSPARRRQLLGTRPRPNLPLRYYHAILERHSAQPFRFDVRMGNYLMTSLLRNPAALTGFEHGHPCREDERLVTVKATGEVTQCPILTELDPDLTMGTVLDAAANPLAEGFERRLPLAGLHTSEMPCRGCALRPVCGGGCRLYSIGYDEGIQGCDVPAKALLSWLLVDPTGMVRREWPSYHTRLRALAPDIQANQRYFDETARGWDAS